jgi:uncharacterized membrane protein
MKKEIIMYSALIALMILNVNNVPFSSIALYIYTPLMGFFYYFSFHHWFKDEKNEVISVIGRNIMALIPISIMFVVKDFQGKNFLVLLVLLAMSIYWTGIRLSRKSISFGKWQKVWLSVISSLPGFFYFFFYVLNY